MDFLRQARCGEYNFLLVWAAKKIKEDIRKGKELAGVTIAWSHFNSL